jgi:xanthine dehydrogenase YagR molybdenum-binding subunit
MRAPGHPQASFAMESLLDELAYKIGMDPVEFRKKNMPDKTYHRQIDRAAREINWSKRNPTPGGGTGPLKRGMGCAAGTWGGGGNDACQVDVSVSRDGSVVVAVGTQDLGTGTRSWACKLRMWLRRSATQNSAAQILPAAQRPRHRFLRP